MTRKRIEGDQVERIIAEGIAGLAIALALLMPTDALAQSRTFYDASGRVSGRSITGSSGSTHSLRRERARHGPRVHQQQLHDDDLRQRRLPRRHRHEITNGQMT
jgi:hypothetical protein